jgi:C-3',4' desaturase CrtD
MGSQPVGIDETLTATTGVNRITSSSFQDNYDIAVIGAGIAGLTAAALLQHDGARVLLLEAHDKPGGCAGYFSIEDKTLGPFTFAAGATVALGFEDNGLHRRVFDYLKVPCAATLLPGLRLLLPSREIIFRQNAKRWKAERQTLPGNRRNQELFWHLQETLADAGWAALSRLPSLPLQTSRDWKRNLALAHPRLLPLLPFLHRTSGDILRILRLQNDREFVALLNLLLIITTQQESNKVPFTNACSGLDLFRHGGYHLRGGIGSIAQLLQQSFERDGGTLKFQERALHVQKVRDGFEIHIAKSTYHAQRVIANLPLPQVKNLIDLPPRAQNNCDEMLSRCPAPWGAVTIYAAVREEVLPRDNEGNIWQHSQALLDYEAKPGEGRDVFVSLSAPNDQLQAPSGWRALTASTHTHLSDWENLTPGQYREQKKQWREKLLNGVRRLIPDFDAGRKFVLCGTPSTWEHYAQRRGVGGVPQTLSNTNFRALSSRLGVRNFYVAGDWTFPGQGTVACALSGINVWREIQQITDVRL